MTLETRLTLEPVGSVPLHAGELSVGAGAPATGFHWLVIRGRPEAGEQTIRQIVGEPASALQLARQCDRPVELWRDDDHLCTIATIAGAGSMWVISPGPAHARQRQRPRAARLAVVGAGPLFEAVFCNVAGIAETDVGSAVPLAALTHKSAECEIGRLRPPPGANCVRLHRSGTVVLRWFYRPSGQERLSSVPPPSPGCSASAQMSYDAMPLAHVVAYEEHRREERRRQELNRLDGPARASPPI